MWPLVLAGQDYFSQCRVVSQSGVTFKSVLSRKTVVCVCVSLCCGSRGKGLEKVGSGGGGV